MTDRQSDKHSPRVDDEMAHDVRSMLQGSPIESRAQEQRLQEDGVTAREPETVIDLRADVARVLRPSAFPGDRSALLQVATDENAEDRLVDLLRTLPDGLTYETFEEAWEKIRPGGAA